MKTTRARKNIKKKLLRVLLYGLMVVIFIPPALVFLFHEPLVQTLSARLATHRLSSLVDNTFSIGAIRLGLREGITIEGVMIKDQLDSTLLRIDELNAKPVYADMGLFGLHFSSLSLNGVEFNLAQYKGEPNLNLLVLINKFVKRDTTSGGKIQAETYVPFKLSSKKLFLKDASFSYYNEEMDLTVDSKMIYSDFKFDSVQLVAHDFTLVDDSLYMKINSLFTNEKSGIRISDFTTDFSISRSGLTASGLKFNMNHSTLDLDFAFQYDSYQSYRYFIDSVSFVADIRPSTVLMSDIGYFTTVMDSLRNEIGITGKMHGPVSHFVFNDIKAHYGNHSRVALSGEIKGLPDFFSSYIIADINHLNTTSCELKNIILPFSKSYHDYTEYLNCVSDLSLNGNFIGYWNKFKTKFELESGEGSVGGKATFDARTGNTLNLDLITHGDTVNIGRILKTEKLLGKVNFDLSLTARGESMSDLKVKSSGTLMNVDLLGYRYSRIRYSGRLTDKLLDANIVVGDHNLMMSADVVAKLSAVPRIAVVAEVKKADLEHLKFWQGYGFGFSGKITYDFQGVDPDMMTGYATLEKGSLSFGTQKYPLKKAVITKSIKANKENVIDFQSDFADLNLTGKYNLTSLIDKFNAVINHYLDVLPELDSTTYAKREYADLKVTLYNDDILSEHFVPGLEISPNTTLNASINFITNSLQASSEFEKLRYAGAEMRQNQFNVNTKNNSLNLLYKNRNTIFRDSTATDKTVFGLDNFKLKAKALKDSLTVEMDWNNADSIFRNTGEVEAYYTQRANKKNIRINHSEIYINDTLWTIDPNNLVFIDSTGVNFKDVDIYGGKSKMNLAGKLPQISGDTLIASFVRWNLSNFDMVTRLWNFELDGIVDGNLQYSLLNENPIVVSDLTVDKLFLNKVFLGRAELFNSWDFEDKSILIKSNVVREGNSGAGKVLALNGKYFPFKEDETLDMDFTFNRIKIKALEPFFIGLVSQMEGVAAGELKLQGSATKPVLTGFVDMHRTQLLINYLNTKYSFSNKVNFEKDKIRFDDLVIYDTLGNFANVEGTLKHEYFQNTDFNINISTDKLLVFNTTKKMNDLYYGSGFVSGKLTVGGNASHLKLNMNLSTLKGTDVKLPLDYTAETSDKDYIVFVNPLDTIDTGIIPDQEMIVQEESDELQYDIDMNLGIDPDARVTIFLPSEMGRIESEGKGQLNMKTNTSGDFKLVGDYVVEDGFFHFSLANLVSKRFDLVEGGRISWTGDPYNASLNLRGLYRLKANLTSLGLEIDTTSTYGNKTNVNCYVILKNQLLKPDIKFEIEFPDLNPDLKRMAYAQLDTTSQAVMNEQMISLLVLGSFSYSNASNISLSSSYYNVISNQLSNMLSKISDDFDIGVNYRPGDNVSEEEFEVALSTQLFDDRLIVDSHLGMTYDKTGQNLSNIVGDVDIGYKVTPDGQWMIKAFNHSNVNSTYDYAGYEKLAPYTQGVGVAFRRDFTHISELFKRTKPPKGKLKKEDNEEAVDQKTKE